MNVSAINVEEYVDYRVDQNANCHSVFGYRLFTGKIQINTREQIK